MEIIDSLKKYILIGVLSGAVVGIVVFISMILGGIGSKIYPPDNLFYIFLLGSSVYGFLFIGLIAGAFLFCFRNILIGKKLIKHIAISTLLIITTFILSFPFLDDSFDWSPLSHIGSTQTFLIITTFNPFNNNAIAPFFLAFFGSSTLVAIILELIYFLIEGILFGYVLNYFMNRFYNKLSDQSKG